MSCFDKCNCWVITISWKGKYVWRFLKKHGLGSLEYRRFRYGTRDVGGRQKFLDAAPGVSFHPTDDVTQIKVRIDLVAFAGRHQTVQDRCPFATRKKKGTWPIFNTLGHTFLLLFIDQPTPQIPTR